MIYQIDWLSPFVASVNLYKVIWNWLLHPIGFGTCCHPEGQSSWMGLGSLSLLKMLFSQIRKDRMFPKKRSTIAYPRRNSMVTLTATGKSEQAKKTQLITRQ